MACTTAAELQYRSCSEPGEARQAVLRTGTGGREEGELELAVASVGAAILSRCGQPQPFVSHFIAAFQAMLKQKFVFFCILPTLPVIYTPPCYSLRNAEFFRKDNSLLWGRKAKL